MHYYCKGCLKITTLLLSKEKCKLRAGRVSIEATGGHLFYGQADNNQDDTDLRLHELEFLRWKRDIYARLFFQ